MSFKVSERVHIVPFGVERDRIIEPVVEYGADTAVLLDYLTGPAPARPDVEELNEVFEEHGIANEHRDVSVTDLFDALAVVGEAILDYEDDEVYVNLATGSKPVAIGGMIACMTLGAHPYYVEAEQHGTHQGPLPQGLHSIDAIPSYPMDRPEHQHLRVMAYVHDSDRTTVDGEPYRIKRELIEFGERAEVPFLADYEGKTDKGKFRRLDAHVISPLKEQGFIRIEEVGTQHRVFLTEDGQNTLRAFSCCIEV